MNTIKADTPPMPVVFSRAVDLPSEWDLKNNGSLFLHRSFLERMEKVNPCNQEYVVFRDKTGGIDSLLVMYDLKVNLLSFLTQKLRLSVKVKVVCVPLSVDAAGIIVGEETKNQVAAFLAGQKGLKIIFNPEGNLDFLGFARGLHTPTHKLPVRWASFDKGYLADMRSNYRRACKTALQKGVGLHMDPIGPDQFDAELYSLYLQVHAHADYTLERLSLEFFQSQPATILRFRLDARWVGFVQLLANGNELIFAFCGFDYPLNKEHGIYLNMLLAIVRYGIEHGFQIINFGQTTDELKMKIGCAEEDKYLFIGHSNPVINWIWKKIIRKLSYKKINQTFNVFKTPDSTGAAPR